MPDDTSNQSTAAVPTLTMRVRTSWNHWAWFVPTIAVVVAMRARYIGPPFLADEGGYLAIARAWGRGATLYRDVFVDRPQGLVLIFRLLWTIGLGSAVGVRLLALAACLLLAGACASIAATLSRPAARPVAALAVGVLTSVPQLEGFAVNGELLGSAVGAAALAVTLRAAWTRDEPDPRLLTIAGVLAAGAISVKQSGFDAPLGAIVAMAVAGVRHRWSWSIARRASTRFAIGVAAPVALMVLHGALTGWSRWWFAIAGYRLEHRNTFTGADWDQFHRTWSIARPIITPAILVLAASTIAVLVVRRVRTTTSMRSMWSALAVLGAWSASSALALFLGGLFHRHYWLLLMPSIGTAAIVAATTLRSRVVLAVATVVVVAVPLARTVDAAQGSRVTDIERLLGDTRPHVQQPVASWFVAHATAGDQLYVMCFGADVYGAIDADPPYPYLWYLNIRDIDDSIDLMVTMLTGPAAPRFVAVYQQPGTCDPNGAVATALEAHYRQVDTVAGVAMLEHLEP